MAPQVLLIDATPSSKAVGDVPAIGSCCWCLVSGCGARGAWSQTVGPGRRCRKATGYRWLREAFLALRDGGCSVEDAQAEEALADSDAWRGLATGLERVCELQAFDRGLRLVMLGTGRGPRRQALVQQRVKPALRGDVQAWDFPMIQLVIAGVTDHTGHPDLWRRYLHLILDWMRAQSGAASPLPVGEFQRAQ